MSLLRIMPVGDSITRGSYLVTYDDGIYKGDIIGLPHPQNGGWRKPLQDKLRQAGVDFDFVGELNYLAYGSFGGDITPQTGTVDPDFKPNHHGLAGFGNMGIRVGGTVPTPRDVLDSLGIAELCVPDIVSVLDKQKPNVILLMAGANGFDAPERDNLIETILHNFDGYLFTATIPPQCPPRWGYEMVNEYNASLPETVKRMQSKGHQVTLVDICSALTIDDLSADGVHPNRAGMDKIADVWFTALVEVGL